MSLVSSALSSTKSKPTGGLASATARQAAPRPAPGSAATLSCNHTSERRACTAVRSGVGLPEGVVEDLQRQRARRNRSASTWATKVGEVEDALAGEQPMVPAPRQHVHGERGGVGELEVEDLVAGDVLDRRRVVPAGEHVEAVQAHPDGRVVGEFDDAPGPAVVVDEAAPGQRLEGDPDVVRLRDVAEAAELVGGDLVGVDGRGGHVAAHQDRVDAEALGGGEGGGGAAQVLGEGGLVDALDVAQRLIQIQRQAQPTGEAADLLGAVVAGDQVGFEDLDAVEAGGGAGVQFLDEGAADATRWRWTSSWCASNHISMY